MKIPVVLPAMVHEAQRQWEAEARVNPMWHACPPNQGVSCPWDPGLLTARLEIKTK